MGRYIAWNDLTDRYPDASRIAGAELVHSAWLYGVEAEVDARLGSRYVVPFVTPTPELVRDVCTDLLYCRMTARQEGSAVIYERVMDLLKGLVAGTISLPGGTEVAGGANYAFASNSYRSAFGPDDPLNWSRSQSELDASESERLGDRP
jgi:phage gp36-like protein